MKVCICTLIKNEHEYLEDWLRYHIDLGVDKIFIVEDIGSEPHTSITEKYSDYVEVLNIPFDENEYKEKRCRSNQYYYQLKMFKYIYDLNIYDWCFIMDIDEFITIKEDISFKNFLAEYNDYTELILYWKNYGANGHVAKPDYSKVQTYREYYTKECQYSYLDKRYSFFMKKGINLRKISQKYQVNQHLHTTSNFIKTNFRQNIHIPCFERAYLSHYITKSWEEYKWKILKRGMCCKNHRTLDDFFEMNTDMLPLKDKLVNSIDKELLEK